MFAWSITGPQLIALLVLAVLLFGKRLPELAASMGKTLKSFQESWHGIESEVEVSVPQRIGTSAPRFDGPMNSPR
jgi:sec-independent protein translocase protein TatA